MTLVNIIFFNFFYTISHEIMEFIKFYSIHFLQLANEFIFFIDYEKWYFKKVNTHHLGLFFQVLHKSHEIIGKYYNIMRFINSWDTLFPRYHWLEAKKSKKELWSMSSNTNNIIWILVMKLENLALTAQEYGFLLVMAN